MSNIVKLNTKEMQKHARKKNKYMYEDLVRELQQNPVSTCTISKAEELADRVLKDGGYENLSGPTPIVKIVKNFGISPFIESLPEEISGNIYINGTTEEIYGADKVIVVGDGEEPYHRRFIFAHELGHYLIDFLGNSDYEDRNKLFSKAYSKGNHAYSEEKRVDRFAAELLMPEKTFLEQLLWAVERPRSTNEYIIAYLSDFFETKRTSIQRRLKEILLKAED